MVCVTGLMAGCAESSTAGDDTAGNETQSDNAEDNVSTERTIESKVLFTEAMSKIKRVSVHDPSICVDEETGTYYVFGTHLATASSTDLVNWKKISGDYENVGNNPIYGDLVNNLAESFEWAGYHDADCARGYAVWAPDVSYNPDYEWEDGSKGAYMLYYSASSTWRRSCIGLAVSKVIDGPYTYVDTLLYSGITNDGTPDGRSTRDTGWYNDYLNFNELLALGSENGGIDEINQKWFKSGGSEYNTDYVPNCIDPCVIDGADGKLYLVYGSWSGGLFMLEIDPKTGLVIYPGRDATESVSGNYIDRYYGVHIAGGNHQSGEGPFIVYDEETGYYYLYETYGGLTAEGGYNMRLFRSEYIYGPYVDAKGGNAADNGRDNYLYGIKLLTNYQFRDERGYRAAGHNSALIDADGLRYIIYHQRFDEGNEGHQVRVRQQFLNEKDWPVIAVYENRNETITNYDDADVVGTYQFIDHGTDTTGNMAKTNEVTLSADGSVSGAISGTFTKTDSGRGYDYITIEAGGVTYNGFFFKQMNESGNTVMTFSAYGDNNTCIMGAMN